MLLLFVVIGAGGVFEIAAAWCYPPAFSVDLAGYGGIEPGRAGRVVSPSFDVTLRVNNTCVDVADVAVVYRGVALGWARVEPRDCVGRRWARDVEVVARGRGVGLSQRLRDRMASDLRSGALELVVDVKMYYSEGHHLGTTDIPRVFAGKVTMVNEKIKAP